MFGTKDRRPLITGELRERLWPYLGGIARENGMKALEIGGVADHIHILLSVPATIAISKAMQLIKGGSSKWVHDTFPDQRLFEWQSKYGAFSVGVSQIEAVTGYIRNQEEHHKRQSFSDEFVA